MKRWVLLAARLYPSAWRARYGQEFEALLGQLQPGWRELADVAGAAFHMQMSSMAPYFNLGLAFGALGAVLSVTGPLAQPRQYESIALLRGTAQGAYTKDRGMLTAIKEDVLSRASLSAVIQKPELDLYHAERARKPLQDVIEQMRRRDLNISLERTDGRPDSVRISFRYPDPRKAEAVAQHLAIRFRNDFDWQRGVYLHMRGEPPIFGGFEIAGPPTSPKAATNQHRNRTIVIGLLAGILFGGFTAFFTRQPKRALIVSLFGMAGLLAGIGFSFLLTPRYISSATLRVVPYDRLSGTTEGRKWLDLLAQHESVGGSAQFHLSSDGTALDLHFTDRDPSKAQSELTRICRRLIQTARADIQGSNRPGSMLQSGIVEYLDAASLPVAPSFPNRLVLGWIVGSAVAFVALCGTAKRRSHGMA